MQAYEFHATAQNGLIRIPDEYIRKVGPNIRVILFSDNRQKTKQPPMRRSLRDMVGVLSDLGDVDLTEARMERLQKYENLD
jgi:sugar phosphate isomerase/epimerase